FKWSSNQAYWFINYFFHKNIPLQLKKFLNVTLFIIIRIVKTYFDIGGRKMDLKALFKISYGVYIISSKKEGKINGQTANTLFQITSDPATVAISINKQNLTHEFIEESGVFSASILSTDAPLNLIGKFGFKSGKDTNKFEGVNYKIGKTGSPIVLDNAVAYLEAEVINKLDAGTHTIFLGKIVDAEILSDKEPMTYAYYHEIKRGTTPKTAPTYIKDEQRKD
ncbi:MAG: flavin reductase family protein, partial [Caldisericia bacterium]|nr:flavin reductase family protein [Caldisericia bacterium]